MLMTPDAAVCGLGIHKNTLNQRSTTTTST
jgi:hypothetical protein